MENAKQIAKAANLPSNQIYCDICYGKFSITRETLREEKVMLHKEETAQTHEVTMTFIQCPLCGKRYVALMDDEETLSVLAELRECFRRRLKFVSKSKPVPEKLEHKYKKLSHKLDLKRHKLAERFNGSFYQTDEGKEQLDYRYRVR